MNKIFHQFRFFGFSLLMSLCVFSLQAQQVELFNEDFGTQPDVFPSGWSADAAWSIATTGVSSGYPGASGGAQARSANQTAGSITYDGSLSTVGFENVTVIWGARRTSTQVPAAFEWSDDGQNWNAVAFTDVNNDASWGLVNNGDPISLPQSASEVSNLRLRWSVDDAGTYRIDDVIVRADSAVSYLDFYLKDTGDLHDLSSWGTNPDGTGIAPVNFTDDEQRFNIVNRDSVMLAANWSITGLSSKAVLGDGNDTIVFTVPDNFTADLNIDVHDNAVLVLENETMPDLGNLQANSFVVYNQLKDSVVIQENTYGNLVLNNVSKVLNSNLSIQKDFVLSEGVTFISLAATGQNELELFGNFFINSGSQMDLICLETFSLITAGNGVQQFASLGGDFLFYDFSSVKSAGSLLIGVNEFVVKNDLTTDYGSNALFSDGGTVINIGRNLSMGGSSDGYELTGAIVLNRADDNESHRIRGNTDSEAIAANLFNLTIATQANNIHFLPAAGSEEIVIAANLTVSGGFTGNLFLNDHTYFLGGNFSYQEIVDKIEEGNSTIVFNGVNNQLYQSLVTSSDTLYQIVVDKPSGNLGLSTNLFLKGGLNMVSGLLNTNETAIITFGPDATVSGGNANAYINGPASAVINSTDETELKFITGKGGNYRPATLTITQADSSPAVYTFEQFEFSAPLKFLPPSLDSVSSVRHYIASVEPETTVITEGKVELSYDVDEFVTDPAFARIAIEDGGDWIDLGGFGTAVGAGKIKSDSVFTHLGEFVIAYSDMPVDLPEVWVSADTLLFEAIFPDPTQPDSFYVYGENLTENLVVESFSPEFEVSFNKQFGYGNDVSITPVAGLVDTTKIYVRYVTAAIGTAFDSLVVKSGGIDFDYVFLSAETFPNLIQPFAYPLCEGSYTFDKWSSDAAAGTYPSNMAFYFTNIQDAPLTNGDMAGNYNCPYNLSSRPRIVGEGSNGISFINTANAQYDDCLSGATDKNIYMGAALLAVNTSGRQNTSVNWTGRLVTQGGGSRIYGISLQYRVGTSGLFTDLPNATFSSDGLTNGDSVVFDNIMLPPEADNQPMVQIRWVYHEIASGGGTRPRIGLDNIEVSSENIFEPESDVVFETASGTPVLSGSMTGSVDQVTDGFQLLAFTVRDGGADLTDADNLKTQVIGITFRAGPENTFSDFTETIEDAAIFKGSTKIGIGTILEDKIDFQFVNDIEAPDSNQATFTLRASFKTGGTLPDGGQIHLMVLPDEIIANNDCESSQIAQQDTLFSDTDQNILEIQIAELVFTNLPAEIIVNEPFDITVEARDDFGNISLKSRQVTLNLGMVGDGTLTSNDGLGPFEMVNGVYTFTNLVYDETGSFMLLAEDDQTPMTDGSVILEALEPCSRPTVQVSDVNVNVTSSTDATISWTNGNGSGRILVISEGEPFTGEPVDGITYQFNQAFGMSGTELDNGFVVYSGNASATNITGLNVGNTYHYAMFEFDCTEKLYLKDNVFKGSFTVTSTTDIDIAEVINIYPNPANDRLMVEMQNHSEYRADFYDMRGSLIKTNQQVNSSQQTFDVSGFAPGIYLLRVTINESGLHQTFRFMKE